MAAMAINLNNLDPNNPAKVIPLDPDNPKNTAALKDLQGNILKGHGRHHTRHIFLKFGEDSAQAKKWIRVFSKDITSAFKQREEAKKRRKDGKQWVEKPFKSFVLTANGYRTLGFKNNQIPSDPKFREGMKGSRTDLNDPPLKKWGDEYKDEQDEIIEIHAMITLAHQDFTQLKIETADLRKKIECTNVIEEIFTQDGEAQFDKHDNVVEQFGYVDGRSQPLFLKEDIEKQERTEGIDQYDPSAPLNLVLVKDPNGRKGPNSLGSYFVFRKLEQNVKGFKEREEKLAETLGLEGEEEERAGALVVGRFEDGTPITLQNDEGMHNPVFNNFNYQNDTKGSKCPVQGHIRKVNPRSVSTDRRTKEREQRIARRGITYGKRKTNMLDRPEKNVGLLFMCFQANIGDQFETQQKLANNPTEGIDPVIGQTKDPKIPQQQWPPEWAKNERKTQGFAFGNFVKLRGGEYFFAPSISFLKNIDTIKGV
jgi:Dyp-type peroxidase family